MKLLARIVAVTCCVWFVCTPSRGENHAWRTFTSREGWSIQYPSDWRTGTCHSCTDPHAPGVFVDFFPPSKRDQGLVIVEPLERKPSSTTAETWLAQIASNANQNPRLNEQKLTVAGEPTLRVRYRAPTGEMEQVFVVWGAKTFSITFDNGGAHGPLEKSPHYADFNKMVGSFRFQLR